MTAHEYSYPKVVEIHPYQEPLRAVNFNLEGNAMVETLGDRLINHNERQISYYERQRLIAEKELARLSILYSGQLQFELPDEPRA